MSILSFASSLLFFLFTIRCSDVTWELPEEIKDYQSEIDAFLMRNQQALVNASSNRPKQRPPHFTRLTVQPPCVAGMKILINYEFKY